MPILLLANMFLGIYYNLSIWYKLTHKTIAGAYITLIGAALTLLSILFSFRILDIWLVRGLLFFVMEA